MRIYTKTGDTGETKLLFGGRVSKADARCEAYGTLDQAVSAMGLARALSQELRVREVLLEVQREMFAVGAELATSPDQYQHLQKNFTVVTEAMVTRLESTIDELEGQMELPASFIVPGPRRPPAPWTLRAVCSGRASAAPSRSGTTRGSPTRRCSAT